MTYYYNLFISINYQQFMKKFQPYLIPEALSLLHSILNLHVSNIIHSLKNWNVKFHMKINT